MPEYPLDPHVVHSFDAEPVYVEGSRQDQALIQDRGAVFGATRWDVKRSSLLTYEAEVDLTSLSQTCAILFDTDFVSHHYAISPDGDTADTFQYAFYLDELIGEGFPHRDFEETSGQIPFPPYVTGWDGGQSDNVYTVHDALPPEEPDQDCAATDFPPDKFFVLDGLEHTNAPCYYYFRPPFPETFRVSVTVALTLPNELRPDFPTDIAPAEELSPGFWQYPVGGGHGPASSQADTTYAHVERVEWDVHRLDVLQFFCGEVEIGPGPFGVVWHPRGGGAVRSIPTIGRQGPVPAPIVPG